MTNRPFEYNENSGSLFQNTRRSSNRSPDMTGKINVDGKMYYVSAWNKQGQQGNNFLSLAVTPIEEVPQTQPNQSTPPPQQTGTTTFDDDDVPF